MKHLTKTIITLTSVLLVGCVHGQLKTPSIPSFANTTDVGLFLQTHLSQSDREASFTLMHHPEKGYRLINWRVATDAEAANFSTSGIAFTPETYEAIAPNRKFSIILGHSHPGKVLRNLLSEPELHDQSKEVVRSRMPPSALDLSAACIWHVKETRNVSYRHLVYDSDGVWEYDAVREKHPQECERFTLLLALMSEMRTQEQFSSFLEQNREVIPLVRWIVGIGKSQLKVAYAPNDEAFDEAVAVYKQHIAREGFRVSYQTYN